MGAQMMIEDYMRGSRKKLTVIAVILFSYGLMALGLFALAKIAL
jgi:succinate dehydrogenase / fumarate reductase membrane anchor subunit